MDLVVATKEFESLWSNESLILKNREGVVVEVSNKYYASIEFRLSTYPNDTFYFLGKNGKEDNDYLMQEKMVSIDAALVLVTWENRSKKFDDIIFVKGIRQLVAPQKITLSITFPTGLAREFSLTDTRAVLNLLYEIDTKEISNGIDEATEVKAMISRSCRCCGKYTTLKCSRCERLFCMSCHKESYHKRTCK